LRKDIRPSFVTFEQWRGMYREFIG